MAGRNYHAIANALQTLAQAIGNPNRREAGGAVEYQELDRFQRNNPSSFNGGYISYTSICFCLGESHVFLEQKEKYYTSRNILPGLICADIDTLN